MHAHMLETPHRFRDPIHGFIYLTEDEKRIVDTPMFQRLRRINQLALEKYVYPSAEHSRFVHSLGVLECASKFFNNLYANNKQFFHDYFKNDETIADAYKTLRFAALLHDIGHLPFSHACEKVLLKKGDGHEKISEQIITSYSPITSIIENSGIKPIYVANLIEGKAVGHYKLLKEIISGEFDSDRSDYLLRDSYECGVDYGTFDINRFINIFKLNNNNTKPEIIIRSKDIPSLESFLLARYFYYIQVIYHKTRQGFDVVLEEYINKSSQKAQWIKIFEDIKNIDWEKFTYFDDYTIFEDAKKEKQKSKKRNPWVDYFLREKHLICYEEYIPLNTKKHFFKSIIDELQNNKSKCSFSRLIATSKPLHSLKTNESSEKDDENDEIYKIDLDGQRTSSILSESRLLRDFKTQPLSITRVYAKIEDQDYFKTVIERHRGIENGRYD